jgi:hypothetical protein
MSPEDGAHCHGGNVEPGGQFMKGRGHLLRHGNTCQLLSTSKNVAGRERRASPRDGRTATRVSLTSASRSSDPSKEAAMSDATKKP